MEDAHTSKLTFGPENSECAFFAIFDGQFFEFLSFQLFNYLSYNYF